MAAIYLSGVLLNLLAFLLMVQLSSFFFFFDLPPSRTVGYFPVACNFPLFIFIGI